MLSLLSDIWMAVYQRLLFRRASHTPFNWSMPFMRVSDRSLALNVLRKPSENFSLQARTKFTADIKGFVKLTDADTLSVALFSFPRPFIIGTKRLQSVCLTECLINCPVMWERRNPRGRACFDLLSSRSRDLHVTIKHALHCTDRRNDLFRPIFFPAVAHFQDSWTFNHTLTLISSECFFILTFVIVC